MNSAERRSPSTQASSRKRCEKIAKQFRRAHLLLAIFLIADERPFAI
jgi:hypothetical protein